MILRALSASAATPFVNGAHIGHHTLAEHRASNGPHSNNLSASGRNPPHALHSTASARVTERERSRRLKFVIPPDCHTGLRAQDHSHHGWPIVN
ncbi:hypothetical protein BJ875DRAFT_136442 [Amylocarpus encephaloides]|uniref:Uncharacterized protein n=1 Tax=Amylocarpus encephaloides TaxID=45428 RepID=A0A9P7YQ42_9HELO|nr:hypothetical protein BJ875DRAFT_136442 [Amylocarpus encephaloides]